MEFEVGTLVVAKQDFILNGQQIFTKGDTYFVEEDKKQNVKYIRDDIDHRRLCIAPFCNLVFFGKIETDAFDDAMSII